MRHEIESREPERDPALAAALREAYPEAPLSAARAQALRDRIRVKAAMLRAGGPIPSSQPSAPTSSAPARAKSRSLNRRFWAVPALLAAAVATLLLVQRDAAGPPSYHPAATGVAVGFGSAEQALSADLSDVEFARVVTREDDPAALLAIAVDAQPGTRTP